MSDEEDYSEGSDEDYVPSDGEAVSEEELSGDEEDLDLLKKEGVDDVGAAGSKRKRQKQPSIVQRKRKGGIKLEGEEVNKEETEEEIKARKELEEKIKEEQKLRKVEQEKKRADDLWSSFMSDVGQKPKSKASPSVSSNSTTESKSVSTTEVKPSDSTTVNKKITITKEFDFAGETVKVTKEVDANSKEAKQVQREGTGDNKQPAGLSGLGIKRPSGGLGSVLDKINKKQKISTLGKSKLDWDHFKKEYKLEDDLKSHNKGKEGYLERVAFLNRTEQRQFEKERDIRLSQSSKR